MREPNSETRRSAFPRSVSGKVKLLPACASGLDAVAARPAIGYNLPVKILLLKGVKRNEDAGADVLKTLPSLCFLTCSHSLGIRAAGSGRTIATSSISQRGFL